MIAPQVHVVSTNFYVILVTSSVADFGCVSRIRIQICYFLDPGSRCQKITGSRIRSTEQRHIALHMMGNANLIQLPCRLVTSMLALACVKDGTQGSIRQPIY
jgi:hypothetical protein